MRVAIVDDIAAERELLRERLEEQLALRSLCADIVEYKSGEDFLAAARKQPFSLAFLDIYMEGMDGIRTAEGLRAFDVDCLLVITTTSTDHALEGFRVRAMHYLVKPYAGGEIGVLLDEIQKRQPVQEKYIEVRATAGAARLRYRDILYAEHFQHKIYIHTTDGKEVVTRQTFGEFTRELSDGRFFLCSRGVIVNLEHARDFDGNAFLLPKDRRVAVSRDLAKQARSAFGDYLFERGRDR